MRKGKLELALGRALKSASLEPTDDGTVELARRYAQQIDAEPKLLLMLGRQFLEALVQLGMTPKARAALLKDAKPVPSAGGLDELRARRERPA